MNLENSLYKVEPKVFDTQLEIPTSKSHSNRAIILGAIRGRQFRVDQVSSSTDVTTLLSCLKSIGLRLSRTNNSIVFHNSFPACEEETTDSVIDLYTGDGGTTNRFLVALLSRGKKTYRLHPSEKMSERPMEELLGPLRELNVSIERLSAGAWLSIQGPAQMLKTSKIEIDCSKSSQFASALMLVFSQLPLKIELKNLSASATYIEMTQFILKETLQKNSYTVPVDFSSLSYPLALALIKGKVLIKNCHAVDPYQADSKFIDFMQKSGGDIQWTSNGLLATSQKALKPFSVNGSYCPDLVMTLAFVAAHIEGESIISNMGILRHKESDRIEEILKLLTLFAVNFQFDSECDELRIKGRKGPYHESLIIPARDHRMVMMAYLFLRANLGGLLGEVDCVEKSFPNFFEIMNS